MDSFSFAAHAKKSEAEEIAYRRKTRLRIAIIVISTILLFLIFAGVSTMLISNSISTKSGQNMLNSTTFDSLKVVCSNTLYPDSCYSSISSARPPNSTANNPVDIFKLSVQVALAAVSEVAAFSDHLYTSSVNPAVKAALLDCKELFGSAAGHLNESLAILHEAANANDIRTLLSGAVADLSTCTEAATVNATEYTSTSLAIATKYGSYINLMKIKQFNNRKLLVASEELPPLFASPEGKLKANVTVAKDGTGNFQSIGAAMEKVPEKSSIPFVIYVKEGVYEEYVLVSSSKWNVVMLGDGMNRTIITGSRNRVDGSTAYKSATFTVEGRGFIAMDMSFRNTAGPEKSEAAALLSKSDRSIFLRCSFQAFHNTLYPHSLRQIYLNSDITGSIDFIIGDGAVVFQNCTIRPTQPISGQTNTITAQARSDPNQNTGTVIQSCVISPFGDLSAPTTFLGRPGKNYSRTVVMMTEIGRVVKPEGWTEMIPGMMPPDSIFFGEYRNSGNGSDLAGRVGWRGYKPKMSDAEAEEFSVDSFIQGNRWINV
ncbi:pectinesterase-like [Phalaenopsis equestris]|uniref:pectinesterase-like n=1 Tax=Phalaenopsis equestris TaxID=78828 RepID=UPI0009E4CD7B|nr:pectinesterase-like [Phalaenopsis equestris]